MGTVTISKPQVGAALALQSAPDKIFDLAFPVEEAVFQRSGNDLTLEFGNGASVTITSFFELNADEEALPPFILTDGSRIGAEEFLTMQDPGFDVSTAAAPQQAASGGGEYSADAGSMLSGVDRLDMAGSFTDSAEPGAQARQTPLVAAPYRAVDDAATPPVQQPPGSPPEQQQPSPPPEQQQPSPPPEQQQPGSPPVQQQPDNPPEQQQPGDIPPPEGPAEPRFRSASRITALVRLFTPMTAT